MPASDSMRSSASAKPARSPQLYQTPRNSIARRSGARAKVARTCSLKSILPSRCSRTCLCRSGLLVRRLQIGEVDEDRLAALRERARMAHLVGIERGLLRRVLAHDVERLVDRALRHRQREGMHLGNLV